MNGLWKKSLRFRLTAILVFISLVIGIVMMFFINYVYQSIIDTEYKNKAASTSKIAASALDGETIDRYVSTREKDEDYERVLEFLRVLQKESGVLYVYVSRHVEGGEIFVFDTDEDEEGCMELGEYEAWSGDEYSLSVLSRLLRGERIDPYVIVTRWGWLLTAHEPIFREDGSVAAYASVDIPMDQIMWERRLVFYVAGVIVLLIFAAFVAAGLYTIQKFVISPIRALVNGVSGYSPGAKLPEFIMQSRLNRQMDLYNEFELLEHTIVEMAWRIENMFTAVKEAEEQTKLMLDTTPLCCQLWSGDLEILDCNEAAVRLYGFSSKQEYAERFFECSPEYQPDGQRSIEKTAVLVRKAFAEGHCSCDWMHQMPDGTPVPAEVTLVRVSYRDGFVVVAYTRDLRDITSMKRTISWLKTEAEKIYFDGLTGIYNRRYFDENMSRMIMSLSRLGSSLSLMMIDIDNFKQYNDTYGHSEGDNCLRIIAETLTKSLSRADDYVARYGGEEFVVVMPGTEESGARIVAEKLLKNVRDCGIPHEKNDGIGRATISIGITTGKVNHTQSGDHFVKRADEMLYVSKQNGRDRYTFGGL
jgi:diguanylate cyclase (GGDEF)-like protein